jgi:hypothetical protein
MNPFILGKRRNNPQKEIKNLVVQRRKEQGETQNQRPERRPEMRAKY